MKIGKIASAFKRGKYLMVYTSPEGEQWIGNVRALYILRGMPGMSPENVLAIFDVPTERQEEWTCDEEELPSFINFSYDAPGDRPLNESAVRARWDGVTYAFLADGNETFAVREDYLKPLYDETDYLYFFARRTEEGGTVIAAKAAMETVAILFPEPLHQAERFAEALFDIAGKFRMEAARDRE